VQIGKLEAERERMDHELKAMRGRLAEYDGRSIEQVAADYARARRPRHDQRSMREKLFGDTMDSYQR
jgi:hypothetical protein